MKKSKDSFTRTIIIYSAVLATVVAILFGIAVFLSINTGQKPHIIGIMMLVLFFSFSFSINYAVLTYLFGYIKELTQAVKKVANGEFDIRLSKHQLNPLDSTFEDFNQMASELGSTKIMKEDFVSQFSHEFKTPITSINGFANLLLSENIAKEKEAEYLKIIAEESKRLSDLSFKILNLTNLENKKIITNKKNVEIDEELRKSLISLFPALKSKNLSYKLDLQKVKYNTDPELLKEVWLNLLNNSIKFTPKKGTVFLSCKEEKNRIEVIIGNNGPKINQKEKKEIFDKFYQGETQYKNEGVGLGLAIVKQILDLLNGEIEVETSFQNFSGTFFKVILTK